MNNDDIDITQIPDLPEDQPTPLEQANRKHRRITLVLGLIIIALGFASLLRAYTDHTAIRTLEVTAEVKDNTIDILTTQLNEQRERVESLDSALMDLQRKLKAATPRRVIISEDGSFEVGTYAFSKGELITCVLNRQAKAIACNYKFLGH